MEIFLEVYGNNKLREKTAEYVGAWAARQPPASASEEAAQPFRFCEP